MQPALCRLRTTETHTGLRPRTLRPGKVTGARTRSLSARLIADSTRHLLRGSKCSWCLAATRTRWRKTRGGIAPVTFQLRPSARPGVRGRSPVCVSVMHRVAPSSYSSSGAAGSPAAGVPDGGRVSKAEHAAKLETGRSDSSRRLRSSRSRGAYSRWRFVPRDRRSLEVAVSRRASGRV